MVPTRLLRWRRSALAASLLLLGGLLVAPATARATTGDVGHQGPAYSGVTHAPTSDKPQSKLWWNDGSWWGYLWVTGSGWHIERLDRGTGTWVDTGVVVDTRSTTLADALWDGKHLYIASEVSTVSTDESPKPSASGQPAKLYRYSYAAGRYTLDAGFPSQISDNSSETLTIDEDSTGVVWATWTQVSGSSTAGYTSAVYVNALPAGSTSWGTPFVLPGSSRAAADDISAVVAYQRSRIGVMWSDQLTGTVWWAWRTDGTSVTAASSWHVGQAVHGSNQADDHLNLKTLQADSTGRVFAAVKTSLDLNGGSGSQPQIVLLVYRPGTGAFTSSQVATISDCLTRPQVVLDTSNSRVHVFAAGPGVGRSCSGSGTPGAIYEKTAPMDSPVFGSGRGTAVIQDAASYDVNNATTSKQPVTSTTGLVVLASNNTTKRYWFADEPLGGSTPTPTPVTAPVAGFTVSPASPVASSPVSFTDTSTGGPTSWSWSFGDGATSTARSPQHTYAAAGTYAVTLTATNAGGSGAVTRQVPVAAAPAPAPPAGAVGRGSSTSATSTAAVTGVSVTRPAGLVDGDVLVASITTDGKPSVSAAPAGWSPVVTTVLSPNSDASVFAYYHVVTSAAAEPASWSWKLSAAEKWNAGVTAFSGVDTASPFEGTAGTRVNTGSASTLGLPSVTSTTPGAMAVGAVGLNSSSITVTAPSGWTEAWEGDGAQTAELASRAMPAAGSTGTATWALSGPAPSAGWVRVLHPAAG